MKLRLSPKFRLATDHSGLPNLAGRPIAVLGLTLLMFVLVPVGVWPQLSARLTGTEYQLKVEPLDPIDPFRGAYVALGYPDLQHPDGNNQLDRDLVDSRGPVYVALERRGSVMVAKDFTTARPSDGPYLLCEGWTWGPLHCGIESWFLPEGAASVLGQALTQGGATATVRIDSRGNAALIDVQANQ